MKNKEKILIYFSDNFYFIYFCGKCFSQNLPNSNKLIFKNITKRKSQLFFPCFFSNSEMSIEREGERAREQKRERERERDGREEGRVLMGVRFLKKIHL